MADEENAILVTLYHLEELRRQGVVEAPQFLTDQGYENAKELVDHGYKLSKEEIHAVMEFIMTKGPISPVETVREDGGR